MATVRTPLGNFYVMRNVPGSRVPDEAYRAPWMRNRQYQGLVSAYSATNITVTGFGTINGNGWPWWDNQTHQGCQGRHPTTWQPDPRTQPACLIPILKSRGT